jgi:hypothetical protein
MGMLGTTGATTVGEYEITIRPGVGAEWTDGTTTPEVYTWKIIKADRTELPVVEDYTGTYDGQPHTFTVSYPYDGYEFEYKVGDGEWTTTKPTRTEIGTTTVSVRTKENSAFNASEPVTAKITINEPDLTGWQEINGEMYYYNEFGVLVTGLFTDTDGSYFYLCEDCDNVGKMLTGLQTINNNIYYFRTSEDDISTGRKGAAVSDFATIESKTYYFRTAENTPTDGPIYSAVRGYATIDGETYFFRTDNQVPVGGPAASMYKGLSVLKKYVSPSIVAYPLTAE